MTRYARRAALVAGLVGAAVGLSWAAPAIAQAQCSGGGLAWGCHWDAGFTHGMPFDGETITLSGVFQAPFGDQVDSVTAVLTPAHNDPECPPRRETRNQNGATHFEIEVPIALPRCNDVYDIFVNAYRSSAAGVDESPPLVLQDVQVALLPPSPGGPLRLDPATSESPVTAQWSEPPAWADEGPPPDFRGYLLERAHGDDDFEIVGTTMDTTLADDEAGSDGAGDYRYRVLALRSASYYGDEPTTVVSSDVDEAPAAEITIEESEATTTTTTDGDDEDDGGGGGPRTGGGATGGDTLDVTAGGTTASVPIVRSGGRSGRPANRSGGVPSGATAPSDGGGFTEILDYSDFEFGTEEAVPPDDADAFLQLDDEAPGAGVAQPIAIGACLAMWAFHLRYLSRRADEPA